MASMEFTRLKLRDDAEDLGSFFFLQKEREAFSLALGFVKSLELMFGRWTIRSM